MLGTEFKSIIDLLTVFPDEQSCIIYLEKRRWNGNVTSPFDPLSKVYKCKNGKYKCKNSGKYFNVKTNTIFESTKLTLRQWFVAIFLITCHKKGISSIQLGKEVGITQSTAWKILQKIRHCFGAEALKKEMTNNTQLDETFVGGKNKNRHMDKKVKYGNGRSYIDKVPVMGMLSNKFIQAYVVPDTTALSLQKIIFAEIPRRSTIISDEFNAYKGLGFFYDHQIIDHTAYQYVNDKGFTTNAIEGFWSILKRGIIGVYHFTSKKHLQKYVNEFVFRYNTRSDSEFTRFNALIDNTNERITYKQIVYGKN